MSVPTFLRVAIVGMVVLECFSHTYPARGQQDVSDFLAQFEREQMEDRRKSSPAYVRTLLEMPRDHGGIFALDTTPDGGMLAGGTGRVTVTTDGHKEVFGGEVVLWDGKSGKLIATLGNHHPASVTYVKFANRDRILVSASEDNLLVQVWDVHKRSRISQFALKGPWNRQCPPAITPRGRYIANVTTEEQTFGDQKRVTQADLTVSSAATGKTVWTHPQAAVSCLSFTGDGAKLIGAIHRTEWTQEGDRLRGKQKELALAAWETKTGEELWKKPLKKRPTILLVAPNQPNLVLGVRGSRVWRWDASSGDLLSEVKLAGKDPLSLGEVAVPSDLSVLAIVNFMASKIGLYNLKTGEELHRAKVKFPDEFDNAAFTTDLESMVCDYGVNVGGAVIDVNQLFQAAAAP
jgi:WD40 repeat protein